MQFVVTLANGQPNDNNAEGRRKEKKKANAMTMTRSPARRYRSLSNMLGSPDAMLRQMKKTTRERFAFSFLPSFLPIPFFFFFFFGPLFFKNISARLRREVQTRGNSRGIIREEMWVVELSLKRTSC